MHYVTAHQQTLYRVMGNVLDSDIVLSEFELQ